MFLVVRLHLALADVPMFLVSTVLGLAVLLAIGICLGGISFLTAKHTHGLAEGIPGLFYVFCGVLFPLSILPTWGQAIGRAIPLTYWFEITRRLIAPTITVNTTLAGFDPLTILLFLIVSSVGFFALSVLIYKVGEYFARKAGKFDIASRPFRPAVERLGLRETEQGRHAFPCDPPLHAAVATFRHRTAHRLCG